MRSDHVVIAMTWAGMITRCYNQDSTSYHYYGGRGIRVCEEWHEFSNFARDMAPRPHGMSLDRIDVNGNYCKENCRWATDKEQMNNKRNNIRLEIRGVTKTLPEWSDYSGTSQQKIRDRLKLGWDHDRCVFGEKSFDTHTIGNETHTAWGWAEKLGIPQAAIRRRLDRGYSVTEAVSLEPIPVGAPPSRFLELEGVTRSISEWSKILGVSDCVIRNRIARGWSVDRALNYGNPTMKARTYNGKR